MKIVDRIRESQGYFLVLTFLVGLLLGSMVIGRWLWPMQQASAGPWDLRPEHQRMFIALVAEDYWRTRDVSRVEEALAGWNGKALMDLLAAMEMEASSPEARQRLAALREVQGLPRARASLLGFLLGQKTIVWGAALSVSPLIAAIILTVSPAIWQVGLKVTRKKQAGAEQAQELEKAQEQLTQEEQIEAQPAQAQEGSEQSVEGKEKGKGKGKGKGEGKAEGKAEGEGEDIDQTVSETPPPEGQEQEPEDQQPEVQKSLAEELGLPQPQERPMDQAGQTQNWLEQMRDWLGQMRERLGPIQGKVPQIQQPATQVQEQVGDLLEQLGQMQVNMPLMAPPETLGQMEQVQEYLGQMQEQLMTMHNSLPENASPEIQTELSQMQLQMAQMLAQMHPVVQQLKEQLTQDLGLDLEDMVQDILGDAFSDEEIEDTYLQTLSDGMEDIEILDLAAMCNEVADQLQAVA